MDPGARRSRPRSGRRRRRGPSRPPAARRARSRSCGGHVPTGHGCDAQAPYARRIVSPGAQQSSATPEGVILVGGEALFDLVYDGDENLQGHPGGAAFTTARTIGRLGQPVAYLGRLSTDRFGIRLERMLAADGVRLDALVHTDEPTTLAMAELDETGS